MRQQQGAQLGAPLLGRLVERREGPLVRSVHTRVVLDEQRRDVHVLPEDKREVRETRGGKDGGTQRDTRFDTRCGMSTVLLLLCYYYSIIVAL